MLLLFLFSIFARLAAALLINFRPVVDAAAAVVVAVFAILDDFVVLDVFVVLLLLFLGLLLDAAAVVVRSRSVL